MPLVSWLAKEFSLSEVQRLAGPLPYLRGMSYCSDGRVEPAEGDGTGVHARVRGTMPYAVRLWVEDGRRAWSCDCPAAEDGSFCKHCVAVALALNRDAERSAAMGRSAAMPSVPAPGEASPPSPDEELVGFVEGLPHRRLVEIVLQQAGSDWRLRERLLAESLALRGGRVDLEKWRRRIDGVFFPYRDFVPREEERWVADIYETIDGLEDLIEAGHPEEAVELVEHAYRCAERAIEYVYPAEGWLSDISSRLAEVHYRACGEGSPDPSQLAARLFELEMSPELEGFSRAAVTYAEILGEVGLAAYREHLDAVQKPSDHRKEVYSRDRIQHTMEAWALATGDPDTVIEVYSGYRMYPSDVMEIIGVLVAAGREDEAVDWAKRGLRENQGPSRHTAELRDFLARALRERGDRSGALELYWDAFRWEPSLPAYRHLVQEADGEADVDTDWSRLCVEDLRGRLGPRDADAKVTGRSAVSRFARPLLDILLYEGRVDEAWDTAQDFGCDQQMWLTLARAREQTHPLDAIGVYEPQVWAQIKLMKNHTYENAVDLMDRIRRLADAVGEPHRFTDLLDQVRTEHWRKRNLKKLLDARGWDDGGAKGTRARRASQDVHMVRFQKRSRG